MKSVQNYAYKRCLPVMHKNEKPRALEDSVTLFVWRHTTLVLMLFLPVKILNFENLSGPEGSAAIGPYQTAQGFPFYPRLESRGHGYPSSFYHRGEAQVCFTGRPLRDSIKRTQFTTLPCVSATPLEHSGEDHGGVSRV